MSAFPGRQRDGAISVGRIKRLLQPPFSRKGWQAAIHPHFHVRIGNITTFTEQDSGLDQIERLLDRIDGFDSHFCDIWMKPDGMIAETEIRFRDASGEAQTIPCVIIVRRLGGKLADLRIILDPSPLFRAIRIDG